MNSPLLPLFALVLSVPVFSARADVVFETSFESPVVSGRVPKADGGNPSLSKPGEKPVWRCFEDQPNLGAEGGSVVVGLTNQIARTGKQSLFVEVSKLSAPYIGALWVTRPIPIEGGKNYRAILWGRNDGQKPLCCATAQLFLKVQIDFYTDEGNTETGESQYLLQPLPGVSGRPPSIVSNAWNPLGLRFEAPAGAKFMVVSFRCDSSAEKGAITGSVYFDDFTVETDPPSAADAAASAKK